MRNNVKETLYCKDTENETEMAEVNSLANAYRRKFENKDGTTEEKSSMSL